MLYLGELLRTMNLGQYSVSAAQPGLAVDLIKNLTIPFPPLEEQSTIVRHIETECTRIDSKKTKTEKLIELLTEYRTALISEVVTGKIKVIE
jgi:type I restriction enzyme S subunit